MSQKLTVTRTGYSALSETNPNNYIFHSEYNTFKILSEGSLLSQSISANPTTITVAHGKNYVPAIMAFIKYPDGYVTLPRGIPRDTPSTYLDIANCRYWQVEVDSTNIYFVCYKGTTTNYNVDIKYYIFEAPSN